MAITVFSRRGVHVIQGKGDYLGLFVPHVEDLVVYRDVPTSTTEVVQRLGGREGIPLWREERGSGVVYGMMPASLGQLRQGLKVWSATDFAPADAEAIIFLFENKWLIHGLKEVDDDSRVSWRTTIIEHSPETLFDAVLDLAGDVALSVDAKKICVALGNSDEAKLPVLANKLRPLGVTPVLFNSLKANPRARLLYRHRDYTLMYLISLFFVMLLMFVAGGWWLLGKRQLYNINQEINEVQQQISSIQISETLGHIQNPDEILAVMDRPFKQQPSSILDAAARLGASFGRLRTVTFNLIEGEVEASPEMASTTSLTPQEKVVMVETSNQYQDLLVNQEALAKKLLIHVPWIREIANISSPGAKDMKLRIVVQIDSPEGQELPPSLPSDVLEQVTTQAESGETITLLQGVDVSNTSDVGAPTAELPVADSVVSYTTSITATVPVSATEARP